MDQVVDKIAGLGVAGLVLVLFIAANGFTGAVALTVALAALGGPFGMIGGMITLAVLMTITAAIAKFGVDALARAVVLRLLAEGTPKAELIRQVEAFPLISRQLKRMLRECIEKA